MPLTDNQCPGCGKTLHSDEALFDMKCCHCGEEFEEWDFYDEETKIATVFYHFVHDFRTALTEELETIEEKESEKEISDLHKAVRFVKQWSKREDRSTIVRHADMIIEESGIQFEKEDMSFSKQNSD